ncbi:MAG: carboxypeptidase-like regulatory domain-containing protein [Flavobacterium sp.]|nr:carboxypeptidase-like regulatory domain-containing protein [Flavobacterium sp.]
MRVHYLIFLLVIQVASSQIDSEKMLQGKISLESGIAEGVNIINTNTEISTTSDRNGFFEIFVKSGDILIFSSVNLEYLTIKIENENLNSNSFIVKMKLKTTQLQEVIINKYPEINAVSLVISPKGIKKYTPAERRLKTAGELHWYSPLLIPLGGMDVDGMINSISGRTTMLKKELVVEKKERLLDYLDYLFKADFFINSLKIPTEYVKGFQYYCVEDEIFRIVLKSKNKIKIEYPLIEYAKKYNEIILEK